MPTEISGKTPEEVDAEIKKRVKAAIRQPVQVDAKTIRRLRKFSTETGISITWIVNHAVNAWLDIQPHGALRMGGFAVAKKAE
ncbi:MAG: hypothetical protein ABSG70_08755 [Terriglobales bacterium]|jgi:hypothetical protein